MSLIKKSDVKNHLSPRRRTAMSPRLQSAAPFTGDAQQQPADVGFERIAPFERHVDVQLPREQRTVPIVMPKRI